MYYAILATECDPRTDDVLNRAELARSLREDPLETMRPRRVVSRIAPITERFGVDQFEDEHVVNMTDADAVADHRINRLGFCIDDPLERMERKQVILDALRNDPILLAQVRAARLKHEALEATRAAERLAAFTAKLAKPVGLRQSKPRAVKAKPVVGTIAPVNPTGRRNKRRVPRLAQKRARLVLGKS